MCQNKYNSVTSKLELNKKVNGKLSKTTNKLCCVKKLEKIVIILVLTYNFMTFPLFQ